MQYRMVMLYRNTLKIGEMELLPGVKSYINIYMNMTGKQNKRKEGMNC